MRAVIGVEGWEAAPERAICAPATKDAQLLIAAPKCHSALDAGVLAEHSECGWDAHRFETSNGTALQGLLMTNFQHVALHRWPLLIDIGLLVLLGAINIGAWISVKSSDVEGGDDPNESATRVRQASTGVLTAAGFLLPLTVLAVQFNATRVTTTPATSSMMPSTTTQSAPSVAPITPPPTGQQKASAATPATSLSNNALVDFFFAGLWLALSLGAGAIVLGYGAMKGYCTTILKTARVGVSFGFQLIFLFIGVLRLLWGLQSLVSLLLRIR